MSDPEAGGQEPPRRRNRPKLGFESAEQFGIRARFQEWDRATDIITDGDGFTPHGRVKITYFYVPGQPANKESTSWPVVDDSGSFRNYRETLQPLVWGSFQDAQADIYIWARDEASGAITVYREAGGAGHWIVIP